MDLGSLSSAHRRLAFAALAVVVGVVLVVRELGGGGAPHAAVPPLRVGRAAHVPPRAALVVDVAGAVRRPGLYRLPSGSRIADALALAGGATARGDVALVNLAAPLADGEQVLVPAGGTAAAAASAVGAAPTVPVDLNTATPEQLDALPGIGPATAAKIVAYRQAHGPFRSLDELDGVPGIGPARIAQLKGLAIP